MTAVTLAPVPPWPCPGVGKLCGYNIPAGEGRCGVVIQLSVLKQRARGAGLLVGNHIVDASSLVSFYQPPWLQTPFEVGFAGWCVV